MSDSSLSTEERVIQAVGKVARDVDITIDSTFEELGVDSLSAIEILFEVEEEFEIDIPGDGARSIRTVRDVVEGVEKLLRGETVDFSGGAADGAAGAPAPAAEPKPEVGGQGEAFKPAP